MKGEDRAQNPAPATDFNREPIVPRDPLVVFLTEYGMTVTPEEADRQLKRAYGKGRTPGYEGRRWDRAKVGSPREPKPHGACEQCGEPLTWGYRFCSQSCHREWVRGQIPPPPESVSPEEMRAQMLAALDALRAYVEEVGE